MKAMILAAGHGKRMRPLTNHLPKPLLKVAGRPLIVWHIEKLQQAGISDIVINMGWQGEKLPVALGDGSQWNVNIQYSDETETGALETAGGIHKALPLLTKNDNDTFIVVNGDIWCDYPFSHLRLKPDDKAHLILVNNPAHNPEGDFALHSHRVTRHGEIKYTFSGIGCYRRSLFSNMRPGKAALAPLLYQAIEENVVSGEYYNGDWQDIGTPERLAQLSHRLSDHP